MLKLSMLATAVTIAFATSAYADVKTDCAADVKSYCAGLEVKGGKVRDCMGQNRAKLSDKCKLAVGERKLEMDAKRAASSKSGKGMSPKDDDE